MEVHSNQQTTRGEELAEVPTKEPTLIPVHVVSKNVQVGITEPATKILSPNLPLSEVNPKNPIETMVKTEESQPSKRRKIPAENVPI